MSTMLTTLDATDVTFGHAEQGCDITPSGSTVEKRSDRINVCIGELGFWIAFANKVLATFKRIVSVVFLCSGRKVTRVNASWVIARVSQKKSVRYWSNLKFVSGPMRPNCLSVNIDRSVSGFQDIASPQPARFSFLNLCKKTCSKVLAKPSSSKLDVTFFRACFPLTSRGWRNVVLFTTNSANTHRSFFSHGVVPQIHLI